MRINGRLSIFDDSGTPKLVSRSRWSDGIFHIPNPTTPTTAGFEAVSFQDIANPNEIVISYAGTYDEDYFGDWVADAKLATGFGSAQLLQAAEYYQQAKAANPKATPPLAACLATDQRKTPDRMSDRGTFNPCLLFI